MSTPTNLLELYTEELRDLWSANDQMARVVTELAKGAAGDKLSGMLSKSVEGINAHTQTLMQLIESAGGKAAKEHCRGMEGLVTEAKKHALDSDSPADIKDLAIISQYQRMCHYGIAGFGTAKAYAKALGRHEDVTQLDAALDGIYDGDDYMSDLAERLEGIQADKM